jgi:hypothetical protein
VKDPERLVIAGDDADRALLGRVKAAPVAPPAEVRLHVRRALERRLFRPAPRSRMASIGLAVAAMLLAGSALGYGLVRLRAGAITARPAPVPPPPPRIDLAPSAPPPSAPTPLPVENRTHAPAGVSRPTGRERALAARARPPASAPLGAPGLAGPWDFGPRDFGSVGPGDEAADLGDEGARPASPRLAIVRERRGQVSLVLAGNKVVGKIGEAIVALTVEPRRIVGKLGHLNVWLSLRGSRAAGTMSGVPIRFELIDTPTGHLLRQGPFLGPSLASENARVHLDDSALTWSPGCDLPLPRSGGDAYRGRCASGQEAQVVIPASWQALAVLPRMILLSLFLPERVHQFPQQATAGTGRPAR